MGIVEQVTIISAGVFFLVGLITGVIKYMQIRSSDNAQAHPYTDICHRASLLYSFATMLLFTFVQISQLPTTVELIAVCAMLFYFGSSILIYLIHGLLKDTDNQLKPPFQVGSMPLPKWFIPLFMWTLVIGEIGGFLVIFYGVLIEVL